SQLWWLGSSVTPYLTGAPVRLTRCADMNPSPAVPGVHRRPSKAWNTGPRQYSCAREGTLPSKRTRNAIASDSMSRLSEPGCISSLRPVDAVSPRLGTDQNGPGTRGNRRNITSASGMVWASRPAGARRGGGGPAPRARAAAAPRALREERFRGDEEVGHEHKHVLVAARARLGELQ